MGLELSPPEAFIIFVEIRLNTPQKVKHSVPLENSFLSHSPDVPQHSWALRIHSSHLFIIWISRNEAEFISPKEMRNEVSLKRFISQVISCSVNLGYTEQFHLDSDSYSCSTWNFSHFPGVESVFSAFLFSIFLVLKCLPSVPREIY